jgi:MFS family permease
MTEQVGLPAEHHAWMYLATLIVALPGVALLIRHRGEHQDPRPVMGITILLAVGGLFIALEANSLYLLGLGLALFFVGFTALETLLPALVSIFAPVSLRGTAMGVFASAQFFGVFSGGILGGATLQWGGVGALFAFLIGLAGLWLAAVWRFARVPVVAL